MKHLLIILGFVGLAAFMAATGPLVTTPEPAVMFRVDCDPGDITEFVGTGTSWIVSGNWDNGVPTASKCAVIPKEKHVLIPQGTTNAACKTLTIEVDDDETGSLQVLAGGVLTLGDGNTRTSTIDGLLTVGESGANATLVISGDHTILGAGGEVVLEKFSVVDDNGGQSDKLTLGSSATPCSARSCSVVLHGKGWVNVALDNRAYVVGDSFIGLSEHSKTGTSGGFWIAENSGTLEIHTDVVGACAWEIVDLEHPGSTIRLADSEGGCVTATGPVTLLNGGLSCGSNTLFCTTGKLTWKSTYNGSAWTQPFIHTTSTSSAVFGLGGAATCSACP